MLPYLARVLGLALLLFLASISARGQYAELDGAAEQVAKKLQSPVPHLLAVTAFATRGGMPSVQGIYLASFLSSAIQFHGKKNILVRDPAAFMETLDKNKLTPADLCSSEALKKLPLDLSIDILVLGSIEESADAYTMQMKALHVPCGATLDTHSISFQKTKFLVSLTAPFPPKTQFPVYRAGVNGVSSPVCRYCPNPSFTDYAIREKVRGKSVIDVLISPKGRIVDSHLLTQLGFGLDEQCIRNLQEWQFKPAAKPDGTPVYAITQVEITFFSNSPND
ncbi:MAG TPA: energy transducer TonB [Candidatus Acidoferrum sp.]